MPTVKATNTLLLSGSSASSSNVAFDNDMFVGITVVSNSDNASNASLYTL